MPPARGDVVSRQRLNARMTAGLAGKLTLIAAPPGFGKTTLVTEWLAGGGAEANRVAWVSLDDGDNDSGRFFLYVLRAIDAVEPGFSAGLINLVQSAISADPVDALVAVINALSGLSAPVVLVLDDFHVITNEAIHEAMDYILEHQPPALHMILTSRTVPPLALARLRGRREINEFRADDLRFTVDEAAAFLNDVMGLDLPTERVAALEQRTEGWIAGLLLAALSAENAGDAGAVLDTFGGEHRYVFDYLAEEVLRRQPDDVRRFLDRTGILNRISADLATELVDDVHAQELLEQLVASNLFTIPLDNRRRWYRYHHLFGEFLAARYRERDPDGWRASHAAACDWLTAKGFRTEAVEHAVAIQDHERLTRLLEEHGQELVRRGRIGTISRWLEVLPDDLIAARTPLTILKAWALMLSRQTDEAAAWLDLVQPEADPDTSAELRGRLAVCRATLARFRADTEPIIRLSREALDCFDAAGLQNDPDYCVALLHLGSGYLISGDTSLAIEVLTRAIDHGHRGVDAVVELNALSQLATAYGELGEFARAEEWARKALDREREYGIRALAMAEGARWTLATILREQERDDEFHALLDDVHPFDRAGRPTDIGAQVTLLYERALFELAKGDTAAALATVDDAVEMGSSAVRNPAALWRLEGLRVHLQLLVGDTGPGIAWAEQDGSSSRRLMPPVQERAAIAEAWVVLERGDIDAAGELLECLIDGLVAGGRAYRLAQARLLLGVLRARQGRQSDAEAEVDAALAYALAQGCRRLPIDTHPEVRPLLVAARDRYAASRPELAAFLEDILPATPGRPSSRRSGMVEDLTEREIEVLRLLAEGLPNRDIADRLFVSVGTIKRHTHNIYSKLDVSNRTRAILRGQELGLLDDDA